MRTFDFAPLFRSTVGFDRMMDLLESTMQPQAVESYPPYNIEKTGETAYRITMAVAGFAPDELTVTAQPNAVIVAGRKPDDGNGAAAYLHRGLALRPFERRFELADHVQVTGAALDHGLLTIELARELPEAMKPRRIAIGSPAGTRQKTIEHQGKVA